MQRRSLMMGGGSMTCEFDEARGQAVGSRIHMGGKAFGIRLSLDEVVTERAPPQRKVWRTDGEPDLIVVGPYEMGFELRAVSAGTQVTVWNDYRLPHKGLGRWFPSLADFYARWCVRQMVRDAVAAFDGPH